MIIRRHKKPKAARAGMHKRHQQFIRLHDCLVCGAHPVQAAHARKDLHAGTSQKTPDLWLIPLCLKCHTEQHGGEVTFEKKHNIDMKKAALKFAAMSPHSKELAELMREDDRRWIANNP